MRASHSFFGPIVTALAFMTRVPVRHADCTPEAIGRASAMFPAIGALAGGLSVAILAVLRHTPMPPALVAVLIVLGGILLTGALHLDGLADTADGFGGGWTRDDVLRIMRDHQIGTFGALALIIALLLQVLAVATLIERSGARAIAAQALLAAPVAGRWGIVLLGRWLPYARPDAGLGRSVTDHVRTRELAVGTLLAIGLILLSDYATGAAGHPIGTGLAALAIALVVTLIFGSMCRRRIGGITGDTLGANVVLCETLILIAAVLQP